MQESSKFYWYNAKSQQKLPHDTFQVMQVYCRPKSLIYSKKPAKECARLSYLITVTEKKFKIAYTPGISRILPFKSAQKKNS